MDLAAAAGFIGEEEKALVPAVVETGEVNRTSDGGARIMGNPRAARLGEGVPGDELRRLIIIEAGAVDVVRPGFGDYRPLAEAAKLGRVVGHIHTHFGHALHVIDK